MEKVDIKHDEFDARKWASEFKKMCPEVDEELMITWFANAIMSGYDNCYWRYKVGKLEKVAEAAEELKMTIDTVGVGYLESWANLDGLSDDYYKLSGSIKEWKGEE